VVDELLHASVVLSEREARPAFGRLPEAERLIDVAASVFGLLFVAPLFCLLMLLMFIGDSGPVLFAQRRIGRGGREFNCLKFRTMVPDAEQRLEALFAADPQARAEWEQDHKLRDDPRITSLGRFLRRSSLDELPQLFNVLKGEMSLVGPRPIVAAEIERYGRHFADYCSIRPGLTGLWQVSGRNDVSYSRRVALDVLYARRKSLSLYVRILLATLPAVLLSRGAH